MATSALWTIVCLGLLIKINKGQSCIQGKNGGGLPSFQDYRDTGEDDNRITLRHQAIISSYKFGCNQMCGNITEWGVDVRADGRNYQPDRGTPYTLDLQVWRPSPTVDDSTGTGCYNLVGNNKFTSISLSDGVALVTPSPQDYIQFRPGDVLGVYVEVARGSRDGVVILTSPSSFTSESMWYASIAPTMATSQNRDCPYSVGSSGILNTSTQAAPVISIFTVLFHCTLLPTTQPTPSPNPSTESEETPLTTIKQPQEPVDPQTSDISATYADSGRTGTEPRVPTTSETATDLSILSSSEPTDIGLIIGIVVSVIVVIVSVVTVVVISTVLFKKCGGKMTTVAVPTTANQAYGLTHHSKGVEESIYNYPEVDPDNTIEAKQNEAYVTNTDITVEGNQAYAMSIITEKNVAYKPVTTVETDEYDYI